MLRMTQVISFLMGILILCACAANPEVSQQMEADTTPEQPEIADELPVVSDFVVGGNEQAKSIII